MLRPHAWYVTCGFRPALNATEVTEEAQDATLPAVFPVSVLMARRLVTAGQWTRPQWEAIAVVAGEKLSSAYTRTHTHSEEGRDQYLWTGLRLELFKDGCESYWHNLMSDTPRLFIVCFTADEGENDELELRPVFVTADQDEVSAHMESDDPVFSVPMPDQVLQALERFVVTYYKPQEKRRGKRKRENWVDGSEAGKTERK